MRKLLHKFLHLIGIYKFPHYFSYYVGSNHSEFTEKEDRISHSNTGSCYNCGHWTKVSTFEEIPKTLQKIKGAWREHCDY